MKRDRLPLEDMGCIFMMMLLALFMVIPVFAWWIPVLAKATEFVYRLIAR